MNVHSECPWCRCDDPPRVLDVRAPFWPLVIAVDHALYVEPRQHRKDVQAVTGGDWVWITVMAGFLILVFCMDRLIDLDDRREAERLEREDRERRYRDEVERLP